MNFLKAVFIATFFFFSNTFAQIDDPLPGLIGKEVQIYCFGSVSCFECANAGPRQEVEQNCTFIGFLDEGVCNDEDLAPFLTCLPPD